MTVCICFSTRLSGRSDRASVKYRDTKQRWDHPVLNSVKVQAQCTTRDS